MTASSLSAPLKSKPHKIQFDFSKPLIWDSWAKAEPEFFALVENPPLHSVVVLIGPKVAESILKMTNTRNRRLRTDAAKALGEHTVARGDFEVTGDTIKFDTSGTLLDGQHRLTACASSPSGLTSHLVFGLPPAIFDVIDQGAKRTAADALELEGFGNPFILAGALNFVKRYESGMASAGGGGVDKSKRGISPREAVRLLNGDYADIAKWVKPAERVQQTYKLPPSIICGVLYLAAKATSDKRAREFAEAWVSGTRDGPNKNFDELARRIHSVKMTNNGSIHRGVLAALMIITWNYWHGGLPVTPRALSWSRAYKFPQVEGDLKKAARKARDYEAQDSSLNATCLRVLQAIRRFSDERGVCGVSVTKLAEDARVAEHQMRYLLGTLSRDGVISLVETGGRGPGSSNRYSITSRGFSALSRTPLPEEDEAKAS